MTTTVQVLERKQITSDVRDAVRRVYLATYGDPGLDESRAEADNFADNTLPRHARRPGFRLALASTDGTASGFAYGFTGSRGQYWSDWLATTAPKDIVATWVGGHFELVDIAVDPSARGAGVGGRLHDALLSDVPHERALLAAPEGPAASLLTGRSWQALVPDLDARRTLYGIDLNDARPTPAT